jgi:hypothetical protein
MWTSHLKDPEQVAEFSAQLEGLQHSVVFKRLLEIIRTDRQRSLDAALKSTNYDSPSWAYTQADNVGYQRALRNIETLLNGILK